MSVGAYGISEKTMYEIFDALESIKPPSQAVLLCGTGGFTIGLDYGVETTEQIRKEFGLGGQLFGWVVVVPFFSIVGAGIGCCIGSGLERGIGKVASVIAKSF